MHLYNVITSRAVRRGECSLPSRVPRIQVHNRLVLAPSCQARRVSTQPVSVNEQVYVEMCVTECVSSKSISHIILNVRPYIRNVIFECSEIARTFNCLHCTFLNDIIHNVTNNTLSLFICILYELPNFNY